MPLRPATLSDQAALFEIYVEAFRKHIEGIWGWDDQWQITNFQKEWDEFVTEVIYSEDELQGYLQTRLEADHLFLLNLALYPQYQNQGLGAEVMSIIKERAMTHRLPLRLNVFKTNQRVIAFYEGLGFKIHAKTETGCEMCWSPPSLPENQIGEQ